MNIQKSKVVIIGAGNVGVTTAFNMLTQGICDEIALIDINEEKVYAEVLDLSHAIEYMNRNVKIKAGTYDDCKDANIIVITASAPMKKGANDRLKMLESSSRIMKPIITNIMKTGFDGHLIIVSNPVDIMTYYAWKLSGLPSNQVIGTGTTLDSARLKFIISQRINVDPRSIYAMVIGEHGDSEMIPWSTVRVGGKNIYKLVEDNKKRMGQDPYEEIRKSTIKTAWDIFERKGNTSYGIASSIVGIIKTILYNENRILPVTTLVNGEYGENNIFISVPTVIDRTGAKEIVEIDMSETELQEFKASCQRLRSYYNDLEI